MAPITRELNGKLTLKYDAALENMAVSLTKGNCIFFLGAGASAIPKVPQRLVHHEQQEPPASPADSSSLDIPNPGGVQVPPATDNEQAVLMSHGTELEVSLPTGSELSRIMAEKCRLEWLQAVPLSLIAFYYESFYTRRRLNELLIEKIGNPKAKISPTINSLNEVIRTLEDYTPHKIYVFTTNYDQHFENSYQNCHGGTASKGPEVLIYKGAVSPMKSHKLNATINGELNIPAEFWSPSSQTVLYKLHGCISQPTNNPDDHTLVITEEDYINFLANALQESNKEKAILNYMRGRLALSTILFIGYSLADWNFRAVFKGTVEPRLDQKADRSYAVQRRKRAAGEVEDTGWDALVEFWDDKKVDILDVDAEQFVKDLLEKVNVVLGGQSKGHGAS